MKKQRQCKGCKYYTYTVSIHYHAVVEGCSRQDWTDIKICNAESTKLDCYAPAEEQEDI